MAPEILLKSAYGPGVDWWALGVVVFELLVGNTPFDADSTDKIFDNILHRRIRWPSVSSELSAAAKDLIGGLLALSPADRLGANGADEIKRHAFFAGVDWQTLTQTRSRFLPALDDETDTRYFDGRNAVFYSPLEVSFSGTRLDQVHLGVGGDAMAASNGDGGSRGGGGGGGGSGASSGNGVQDVEFIGKAFWSLHALNERACAAQRV